MAIRDLGWAGQRAAISRYEAQFRPILTQFDAKQLSFVLYQCSITHAGTKEMQGEMLDLLLPKFADLDSGWRKNVVLSLINQGAEDKVDKYAQVLDKLPMRGPDLAVLLFNAHKASSFTLTASLVRLLSDTDLRGTSTMLLSMALHGLSKTNWPDSDAYLKLMEEYAKTRGKIWPREYTMAIIGGSKHLAESPSFCEKLQSQLSSFLPTATSQGLSNLCHAASRYPNVFTIEQWMLVKETALRMKAEIVRNPLDLTTILHAFNKVNLDLREWKEEVTEKVVANWSPAQVAVGTFSLREELKSSQELRELLYRGVVKHIGAMNAKHRLNMLLVWSDPELYREDRWLQLEPAMQALDKELRDSEHDEAALNQLLSISFRIQKHRGTQSRYVVAE